LGGLAEQLPEVGLDPVELVVDSLPVPRLLLSHAPASLTRGNYLAPVLRYCATIRLCSCQDRRCDPANRSGRCPQGSPTVSGRFRRTPGAAIMYRVASSYTFTGSGRCSGLDLSTPMFAPCLLGCPGTGRQNPVLMSLRLAGLRYSSACHSIRVTQVFKKVPLSSGLLIRWFGVQVPGGAPDSF